MDQGTEPETSELDLRSPERVHAPARRPWPGMMGWPRRRLELIVTLLGLLTFAMRLVSTDPKVLGQTFWSPLQVVTGILSGRLPLQPVQPAGLLSIDLLFGSGIVYLFLIAIAVAILFFPSVKFVGISAAVCCAVMVANVQFQYPDLQEAIFGAPRAFASGHVNGGVFALTLLGVLALLLWVATSSGLDRQ